jgi:hypothetical protein
MRRLFTFVSAPSLLLCLAAGVLWGRSYSVHDRLGVSLKTGRHTLRSSLGRLVLAGPPPPGAPGAEAAARALFLRMSATDYRWDEWHQSRPGRKVSAWTCSPTS